MIPAHIPPHDLNELLKAEINSIKNKEVKSDFEKQVKNYLKTNNYISTTSGRQALFIALSNSEISKGDEVIIPAFTSDVVPLVVREAGGIPIPADVELDSYNIDPASIQERITNKTKAIITVHTYGNPSNIKALDDICRDHCLSMIEDAAPAFGAQYFDHPVGTFGDFGVFSFGLGKSISMGMGGGLVVSDGEILKKLNVKNYPGTSIITFARILGLICLSNPFLYGILGYRIKDNRVLHEYDKFKSEIIDKKDNPSLCYSIGLLELASNVIENRRSNAREYNKIIDKYDNIYSPVERVNTKCVYTRYFLRAGNGHLRDKIYKSMISRHIEPQLPDMGYPISQNLYPVEYRERIKNSLVLSRTLIGIPVYQKIPGDILRDILSDALVD